MIIQDDVEIGANTTIDRGALKDTIIGEGTKIDNLVQIGHNVVIGRHCVIVGQVGIAGSTELGDFVVMGGQAGVVGHIKVGSGRADRRRQPRQGRRAAAARAWSARRRGRSGEWAREQCAVDASGERGAARRRDADADE